MGQNPGPLYRGTILDRPTSLVSSRSISPASLTPTQARADALVSSFVDHATDGYALAGMVGGGLVYRLGRLGTLAVGSRLLGVGALREAPLLSSLIRYGSVGVGFTGEVFAFEGGQRALRVGIGGADPNLLNWSGENGLGRGLVGAAITLGPLKGAGVFAQGQNPVIQHLFQDSAMVLAHNVSGAIGITNRPAESIPEQMVNAEATLWQMNAGMALVHGAFPTLGQVERSLDLSIRSNVGAPLVGARQEGQTQGLPLHLPNELLLVAAGNVTGRGRRSPGLPDHVFAMSSTNGNDGEGGDRPGAPPDPSVVVVPRSRPRGDETIPIRTYRVWRPYEIEGIPAGAPSVELDANSEDPVRDIFHVAQQELTRERPGSLVINFNGGDFDMVRQMDLRVALTRFMQQVHAQRPLPEDLVIAVGIPQGDTAMIFRPQGDRIRMERVQLDLQGKVALRADDTPDEAAEASAAQARFSLPPNIHPAATVMQIFDVLKRELPQGDVTVQYQTRIFGEEQMASQIADWLRRPRTNFQPGHNVTLLVPENQRRIVFFWEGSEVQFRIEPFEGGGEPFAAEPAPPSLRMPPPPEIDTSPPAVSSEPDRTRLRRRPSPTMKAVVVPTEEVGPASAAASVAIPRASAVSSRLPVVVATTPSWLVARVKGAMPEGSEEGFALLYTGNPAMITERDWDSLAEGLSDLPPGQSGRVYLTQSKEIMEFSRGETGPVSRNRVNWPSTPSFTSNSVRSWGEFFETLLPFLSPHREISGNPIITYMGKSWNDTLALEMIGELFSEHLLSEEQSLSLRVGRENRLVFERTDQQIVATLEVPGEGARRFFLIPEAGSGHLVPRETLGGHAYRYQAPSSYYEEAAQIVKAGMGVQGIGRTAQARIQTGLPVETVIQSPPIRGRLLAEIANEAVVNHSLPNFIEQWVAIHRFIEKAYVHLDFEAVESFQRHIQDSSQYRDMIRSYNEKAASPEERLVPLEEMPVNLPGQYIIPKSEILRDAFLRQMSMQEGWSPYQIQIFLRDPFEMAGIFTSSFRNGTGSLLTNCSPDILQNYDPQEGDLSVGERVARLLDLGRTGLSPQALDLREDVLRYLSTVNEYERFLTEGRGPFHLSFLRGIFFGGPRAVRGIYEKFHLFLTGLPLELRQRLGLKIVPSLADLEAQIPEERRRPF